METCFAETWLIDCEGTKKCEQAYSFRNGSLWIHLLANNQNNYFLNYKKTDCVSIRVLENDDNMNDDVTTSKVSPCGFLTFNQAEKIINQINENKIENHHNLKNLLDKIVLVAKQLKYNRLGNTEMISHTFASYEDNLVISNSIAEISTYANSIIGRFIFNDLFHNRFLNSAQFNLNPFDIDRKIELMAFFDNIQIAPFMETNQFFKERIQIYESRGLIDFKRFDQNKGQNQIKILKTTLKFIQPIIDSIILNYDSDIHSLIYSLEKLKTARQFSIFPELVYFTFEYLKLEPKKAKIQNFKLKELNNHNNYNFHVNKQYYNYNFTHPLKEQCGFVNLIYNYLICSREWEKKLRKVNDKMNSLQFVQEKHKNEDNKKRNNLKGLIERCFHMSVVCQNFQDNNCHNVLKLKFPLVLSFYDIAVNKSLNISELFAKYISLSNIMIDLIITDNSSFQEDEIEIDLPVETWTESISEDEYKFLDSVQKYLNKDIAKSLDLTIKISVEKSKRQDIILSNQQTINTICKIKFDLNDFFQIKKVLAVQFCIDKFTNLDKSKIFDWNKYKDEDFKRYYPDAKEPPDNFLPSIQLIKLNSFFNFCVEHHPVCKNETLWLIKSIKIKEIQENFFQTASKRTKSYQNFLKNEYLETKSLHVCLSSRKKINEIDFEFKRMVIDNEYVLLYHGIILNFEVKDVITINFKIENKIENELTEFKRFKNEGIDLSQTYFDLEIFIK
ncbi:unnamed protein product [Brachionus calyciflorus]|uniref:Uncharacterized protein n=1 Tax=Brachionus calyciflorus TaxID=104777 RepID=A0A814GPC4_9BILA|nr:unnamed protein product [Brachionus calyciflorus]